MGAEDRLELEMRVRRRKSLHGASGADRAFGGCGQLVDLGEAGSDAQDRWHLAFCRERPVSTTSHAPVRQIGDEKIAEVVTRTLETMPEDATHWSRRSMAEWHLGDDGPSHLGRVWLAATPGRDFQAVERPAVHRQDAGHCWPLSRPARAGAVHRREEPNPGAAPSRCCPCDRAERHTHDDKRTTTLFAARGDGRGHRTVQEAAPGP